MHLSRLFQRTVRRFAGRPAVVTGTGPAVTYAELDLQVRALARWLRDDLGLQPGDRVTLAMANRSEYALALLAIWHARLCAVPVNSKLHPAEIAYILEDSDSRLCLTTAAQLPALREAMGSRPNLRLIDVAGEAWARAMCGAVSPALPLAERGDAEPAWLFYTSGTTGRPKGVMLSHANLVLMAMNFQVDMLAIDETDVIVHVAPMSHGSGLYGIAYWMQGGLQVIPASGGLDEAELFDLLRHYRRASLFAAPTIITRMVRHAQHDRGDVPGLRCLFAGGAPFYVEDIKAAVHCFGSRVAQMYGQGETPMTISALKAELIAQAVAQSDDAMLASVGHPQTTVDVTILGDDGLPATPGAIGEVVVRSPTVMSGYWRNPQASAQALDGDALRTGDVGLIDERGLLHLKDRSKDVIISGGSNIYPREVEEALLHHPSVAEVSVIGVPDPEWGEAVTAVVVTRAPVAESALDEVCVQHIARFKRPKHYVFVDSLPKNPTGKILKAQLRERFGRKR